MIYMKEEDAINLKFKGFKFIINQKTKNIQLYLDFSIIKAKKFRR